ncbi:MAG: Crp/Fnr family transcriptional regulator [Hyphomicrobiales bacterium]|nr:Crp/Fnr family transcriptional regulator [Hyphomicrobiales bacterium]MDE2016510.1 Crp/Fnr family transcriptional regulator [Hyphomicrobiales bacterium]
MAIEDTADRLMRIPPLDTLGREAARLIAFAARPLALRMGETLFEAGEAADCGYAILSGAIRLDFPDGRTNTLGADRLLGELALVVPMERDVKATVVAAGSALRIERDAFLRVLGEYPDGARRLQARLIERFGKLSRALSRTELGREAAGKT